ncbi:MAG: XTP/dITP diphosphatase [Rickettsiales bacterium]|nr:MAG: XTP/dITP diphosphatase [Rickettsiales bacterium]
MTKLVYLTTNPDKIQEAQKYFEERLKLEIEIMNPSFELIEIQAKTCLEVVAFTVKYAADKLGKAVIKSDAGFYIDALGGLPGPYSAYFDKQIGVDKFLELFKNEKNRKARIEHCWAYCEPNKKPVVFSGGSIGTIAMTASGESSRWLDHFFVPDGEIETISAIRDRDYEKSNVFWGDAKEQLAKWLKDNLKI